MNSKNRTTLEAVFSHPTKANIKWSDIESLLASAGATIKEGEGSRVRITKGQNVLTAHRPHPGKEAKRYQVIDDRIFLEALGVKP
jgi:mRNA degradation ribonuclease J1/J2